MTYPIQGDLGLKLFDNLIITPSSAQVINSPAVKTGPYKSVGVTITFTPLANGLGGVPAATITLQSTNESADPNSQGNTQIGSGPQWTGLFGPGQNVQYGKWMQPGSNGTALGWVNVPSTTLLNNVNYTPIQTMTTTGPFHMSVPFPYQDKWVRAVWNNASGVGTGVLNAWVQLKA